MPDKFIIRRKLLEQLGRRRFIKFVRSLPRTLDRHPLRYWQEEAWAEFCANNPELATSVTYVPHLLRYCMIHGCDLELFPVKTTAAILGFASEKERRQRYSEAPPVVAMVGQRATTVLFVPYWACPDCAEIQRQRRRSPKVRSRGYVS